MPQTIYIGTDIALIGVWDPSFERHDLQAVRYADYKAGLQNATYDANLFFIETGADGGYPTAVYVDEQPSPDCLALYNAFDREYLIQSRSGQLIAGGVEDFTSSQKQITSDKDWFAVQPGFYAISVFQREEGRFNQREQDAIGVADYEYYQRKSAMTLWGCWLLIPLGVLTVYVPWTISVGLFMLWVVGVKLWYFLRARDSRFNRIEARLLELDEQYPTFLFVLRRVTGKEEVSGGWLVLSSSDG